MSLEIWHNRLLAHYTTLRSTRPPDLPLFALEHGLSENERHALNAAIRATRLTESPNRKHRLAWVVYASEIGYGYWGEEYWQTFEEETPGWEQHGNRGWLRQQFEDFAARFGGAIPTGRWAMHRSIIGWPITHAILPQDLQMQLARVLYLIRHTLQPHHLNSPAVLGARIASISSNTSSRFRNFVQEHQLVGQIALALLLDKNDTGNLLDPATLQRILVDLEASEESKQWLRTAQRQVQETVHGLSPATRTSTATRDVAGARARQAVPICDFLLIPSESAWNVCIETPDYSTVGLESEAIREWLASTRATVPASSGRLFPGRQFLYGPKRLLLTDWPQPDQPLIKFSIDPPNNATYLLDGLRPRPGFPRLFKMQPDGSARALRQDVVRPGSVYVLTGTTPLANLPGAYPLVINCHGVSAIQFKVPSVIDDGWSGLLSRLGLILAGSLRVWPVGIVPVLWDDTGQGTWLEGDPVILGVQSTDVSISVRLEIEGGALPTRLDVDQQADGVWYAQILGLSPGLYRLQCIVSKGIGPAKSEYTLDVTIREPRRDPTLTTIQQSPLQLVVDPPYPTLEQMWEAGADVRLNGPAGSSTSISVSLLTRYAGDTLAEFEYSGLKLPIDDRQWQSIMNGMRANPDLSRTFDEAKVARFTFDAGELGHVTLNCERVYAPVRWAVKNDRKSCTLRLIDESDGSTPLSIQRFDTRAPEYGTSISLADARRGVKIDAAALLVAQCGTSNYGVIAAGHNWTQHMYREQLPPPIVLPSQTVAQFKQTLELIKLWRQSHLAGGSVAASLRNDVAIKLHNAILQALCGRAWMAAEQRLFADPLAHCALSKLVLSTTRDTRIQYIAKILTVSTNVATLAALDSYGRARKLSTLIDTSGILPLFTQIDHAQRRKLTEFALCLASCPERLIGLVGAGITTGVQQMLRYPELVRIARAFVIALEHESSAQIDPEWQPARWDWNT